MEVFRISKTDYADKLTSSGSANRWNYHGQHVIYTGSSRSLSTLELIVHRGTIIPKIEYKVMVISIADDDKLVRQILVKDLAKDWRKMSAYAVLQKTGSEWYENQETLVLKVPSAVIPKEYNYIINTEHPDFLKYVQLIRTEEYFWDTRLF
ncbi:RES family NAD+ phosphorylase [Saccharicrinis sp. FJH2]|uniref:RES family NAD+ phosphorylase n=1 Tax=Saccharicrinis sp. FJH65 TaxID=3344659 RepID=UPI0035F33D68